MGGSLLLNAQDYSRINYEIRKVEKPTLYRTFVVGGPARAISVGNPEGVHYCFDAENPRVVMAWSGDFMDIGPDRGYGKGRGGSHSKPLGQQFATGDMGFPFLVNGQKTENVEFLGYRLRPVPEFYYSINDSIKVAQKIKPASKGTGLEYHFEIQGADNGLTFQLNEARVNFYASEGKQSGGKISLSAKDAEKFVVTVHPR